MPTPIKLPDPRTRWTMKRKGRVVAALACGQLSAREAITRYGLSSEELEGWIARSEAHGERGLRSSKVQQYPL